MAACFCIRLGKETVKTLDFRHCDLHFVPEEIVEYEDTLEELYLDSNDIRELPRDLFHCLLLRKLGASDNELVTIPSAVANLINLEELDISKNGIVELPDNIKSCKKLALVEVSVNPLGKLPEGFTQLMNLTQLYLNDTLLDYLPANFGRLTRLKVLELRDNRLKALPKSISRLSELERLDLGQNSFKEIPDVIGSLTRLTEVWIDANKVIHLPSSFGNLTSLVYFDASCNRLAHLPTEMGNLQSLTDLHLSKNFLHRLPDNIGQLSSLTTLKADCNQLSSLPDLMGGLESLEELILSANDLEELPPSIGRLRRLRHLNVDENLLMSVPPELGSCSSITLLSLRGNFLQVLPDEIGHISSLTVVNLSNNRLQCLPFSFTKLKNLQALWLSENQSKPLIPLQSEVVDQFGTRVLTCFLFPQQPQDYDEDSYLSEGESFHQSVWEQERTKRQRIAFDVAESEREHANTARSTTPYPKETIRPRFRMGAVSATPNGHIPSKRPHLADRVHNTHMELLPSKPSVDVRSPRRVRGRREMELDGIRIREAKVTRPKSPGSAMSDSLHLFQADKEKRAKDKARIRRTSSADSDAENASPRSSKGFFKKGKSDRGAHSDTEVIDPEWTPRKSNMRRSLTLDQSLGQEGNSRVAEYRSHDANIGSPTGQNNKNMYAHQNGRIKQGHVDDTDYRTVESGHSRSDHRSSERRGYESDYVEGRKTIVGADPEDGVRRRPRGEMKYHGDDLRRHSLTRNMNADPAKLGDTPTSSKENVKGRRNAQKPRSGYGTDPELEELYHNSLERRSGTKHQPAYQTPPKKTGYDVAGPNKVAAEVQGSEHRNSKPVSNPYSGYGTDSEVMAYTGLPFDSAPSTRDHGRSSRGVQRTLERQSRMSKEQGYHTDSNPRNSAAPGRDHEVEERDKRTEDAEDEELQWVYLTFSPEQSAKGHEEEQMPRRQLTEEPKPGFSRHHARNHPVELGRIAVANASVQRSEGHSKESEIGEHSSKDETDNQQTLQWDISEILGSSSQTGGQSGTDTPAASPQKGTRDDSDQSADRKGNKKVKSSTPEDVKQVKKGLVVIDLPAPKADNSVKVVEGQMNNLRVTPSKQTVHEEHKPPPTYFRRRDPNSPLPPSPADRLYINPPPSASSQKNNPSPSPLPGHFHRQRQTDSPVPTQGSRFNSKGSSSETSAANRIPSGFLQDDQRHHPERTPSKETPLSDQPAKRGAIPSYEEALRRRRESLNREQVKAFNSLSGFGPKVQSRQTDHAAVSNDDIHDTEERGRYVTSQRSTTSDRLSNERERPPDDYESVDDWYPDPESADHEVQGQPHDREAHLNLNDVHRGASPVKHSDSNENIILPQGQKLSIKGAPQMPNSNHDRWNRVNPHTEGNATRLPRQQDQGDEKYLQWDLKRYRDETNNAGKIEADINRNFVRGQSPVPDYAAHRITPYQDGHLATTRGRPPPPNYGHQASPSPAYRRQGNPPEYPRSRDSSLDRQAAPDPRSPQDAAHRHAHGGGHGQTPVQESPPPYRGHPARRDSSAERLADGTRNSPEVNEENWRRHLLAKLAKKNNMGHAHQTPISIRSGGGHPATVQSRRLQVLRARMQNEMRSSDDCSDDVFHTPVLPSRSPAGPHPHQNTARHHQHPSQPHPNHAPHLEQTEGSLHRHPHYHPSSQSHVYSTPPNSLPEDQGRRGPPPSYHRDESPPTYGRPPAQIMEQMSVEDLRRGTPPGSSGSSTTGGNGRGFAPSPSLQRRLHPYQQTPTGPSQSPLPMRRADPDGTGGPKRIPVSIYKNPGLGFSITGGKNSPGNPYHPEDMGIFVTKVQPDGPADHLLVPGDKILEVNDRDFLDIDHEEAVTMLKISNPVAMVISRET
ncbi:uncharacterized protein [Diadema antillarum]|uniref:uncharacterized protein n=1 Tax=Diadema antillarum TaxID=105358 RepID=UPI003A8ACF01